MSAADSPKRLDGRNHRAPGRNTMSEFTYPFRGGKLSGSSEKLAPRALSLYRLADNGQVRLTHIRYCRQSKQQQSEPKRTSERLIFCVYGVGLLRSELKNPEQLNRTVNRLDIRRSLYPGCRDLGRHSYSGRSVSVPHWTPSWQISRCTEFVDFLIRA
jgi:hypothetical protein